MSRNVVMLQNFSQAYNMPPVIIPTFVFLLTTTSNLTRLPGQMGFIAWLGPCAGVEVSSGRNFQAGSFTCPPRNANCGPWPICDLNATHFYYTSISSLSLGALVWYIFLILVALSPSLLHYPRRKWCEGGRNELHTRM